MKSSVPLEILNPTSTWCRSSVYVLSGLTIDTYLDNVLPVTTLPVLSNLILKSELEVVYASGPKYLWSLRLTPPNDLILSISGVIPKQLISALSPLSVPLVLIR